MGLKKIAPYIGILAVGLALGGFIFYKHKNDLENIKAAYIAEKDKETEAVAKSVEDTFKAFYQGLRTISLLPGVKEIDRYGKTFDINSKKAVQQIYNNIYLNVNLSEVYILPKSLDPDKIDPFTGKSEEPIITFDHFILADGVKSDNEDYASTSQRQYPQELQGLKGLQSHSTKSLDTKQAASDKAFKKPSEKTSEKTSQKTTVEESQTELDLEEVEIYEYRLMKKQLEYLSANFPKDQSFEKLNVPAVTGEPVITCDNSDFTREDLAAGNNRSRMGFILTLPIYGNDQSFRGAVSGVVRTKIIEKLIPKGSFAIVNAKNQYMGITEPTPEFNQARQSFENGKNDPDLIYSRVTRLNIVDSTVWELWVALPNKDFLTRTTVKQATLIFWSGLAFTVVMMIIMASFVRYSQRNQEVLESKVEEKTKGLQESNQAIKTILDHVSFGLLICDNQLKIRSGYSSSCNELLSTQERLEDKTLIDLLNLNARSKEHFRSVYQQIFDENFMIGDLSVDYLPTRFHINSKVIGLTGSVIHNELRRPVAVLFCLSDITNLVHAEEEIEKNRCMIKIVSNRDSFRQFIKEVRASFANIFTAIDQSKPEQNAGLLFREIHTLKGNFATYGLSHIAKMLHELEEAPVIDLQTIKDIEQKFIDFLIENKDVFGFNYDKDSEDLHTVPEHLVSETEEKAAQTSKHEHLKDVLLNFFRSIRLKTAKTHLGPIEENFNQLAERLGKNARLEILGGELLVATEHSKAFKVFIHLIRNSLDHGIEPPHKRGGKPECARVRLEIKKDETSMTIEISDDGQGISREKISKAAIQKKMISPDNIKSMTDGEIYNFIFESGLSTAEEVSDISGRGIGLEAVKKAVKDTGGDILVRSKLGEGTVFTITLPFANYAPQKTYEINHN